MTFEAFKAFKAVWNDNAVRTQDDATTLLVAAYRYQRQPSMRGYYPTATQAIDAARHDTAINLRRYPRLKAYPAVCWQSEAVAHDAIGTWANPFPGKPERLAGVERPEHAGLRFVGRVQSDCGGRNGYWSDTGGWYTDPYGDTFRDGSGLCYGVVYQLPGREGKARFVAGYEFGGCDGGPTIDLSTIYEERAEEYNESPADMQAAHDAANAADSMASKAAEEEREYQTAWQAGNLYSDCLEELKTIRESVLATIRDMKGACATLRGLPETLKSRIKESLESDLEERSEIFAKMKKIASGEYHDLCFYERGEREIQAFNEAAGRVILR